LLRLLAACLIVLAAGCVAWAALQVRRYPVSELARHAPRRTALMLQREAEARRQGRRYAIDTHWVSLERISPLLRRAVLIAEDDKFFSHGGFDWSEIREAARKNLEKRRVVRGASTLTQQLAKNLYLGDRRTLTRKIEEALLAVRLERALSKRRIFELYLNEIEWGDGIYGAEAAARRYFGIPASELDPRQAVLLAAVIINPRRYSVLEPSRRIEKRARMIASRMRRRGLLTEDQYLAATGGVPPGPSLLERLLGARPETTATLADSAREAPAEPGPAVDSSSVPEATPDTVRSALKSLRSP